MSFDDMRDRPIPKKSYGLRNDWSAEDKIYKEHFEEFQKSIAISNIVSESPAYSYQPEKIIGTESIAIKEVKKEPENNTKLLEDEASKTVESNIVQRTNVESLALQPTQPAQQESVLSTSDSNLFDDDFLVSNPKTVSKTDNGKVQESANIIDDFFETLVIEQPKKSVAQAAPAPVDTTAVVDPLEEIIEKANTPSKPKAPASVPPPSSSVAPTELPPIANSTKFAESSKSAGKTITVEPTVHGEVPCAEVMEGFDYKRFEKVKNTANAILAKVPNFDLDGILASMTDYIVCLDFDYLREDPEIITKRLLEVQAKRDALYKNTMYLASLAVGMKHAAKVYEEVGCSCSNEKSSEKRVGQVRSLVPEFYIRFGHVESTEAEVDKMFRKLAEQYECISRLITKEQMKNKNADIARGEYPFEQPSRKIVEFVAPAKPAVVEPVQQPRQVATGTPPKAEVEDDFLSRNFSQPLSSNSKFNSLDSFDSGSKMNKNTTSNNKRIGTSEAEW